MSDQTLGGKGGCGMRGKTTGQGPPLNHAIRKNARTPKREPNLCHLDAGHVPLRQDPMWVVDEATHNLRLKEAERLAAGAGLEAVLDARLRDIDHVHRAVALARNEQFVAAERHVHRLAADLDRGLLAK